MQPKDICLFDLDGTLIDSAPGILNCVDHALSFYGITEKDPAIRNEFLGPPLYNTFMRVYGFSHEQALEAVEHYRERFRPIGVLENTLYPGIRDLLTSLHAHGKTVVLATSKPLPFARIILDHYEITGLFDFIGGGDISGKRALKSEVLEYILAENGWGEADKPRMVMIGDRRFDVEGAKALGLDCVGVLYGYGSREELLQAGADALAGSPAELLSLLLKK